MRAMILAAGLGTRLRPITQTLPKPMVPLCNQPLIGWAVESLLKEGIRDLIVNLHHLPEAIESYLPAAFPDARFEFSFEPEILGTGGGIRKVQKSLSRDLDFFLVNGDTVQFAPFAELRAARLSVDALAALTLRHAPDDDYFTPVWFDGRRITGFVDGTGESLIFSGSHCISSRVFAHLPHRDVSSIVDDVYRKQHDVLTGVVDDGPWFDIGTPQRYIKASNEMLDLRFGGRSLLDDTARGRATHSAVGARSVIEGDVRDCAIWDDCRIGPDVTLDRCIVAHGVELTGKVRYSSSMICRVENELTIVSI